MKTGAKNATTVNKSDSEDSSTSIGTKQDDKRSGSETHSGTEKDTNTSSFSTDAHDSEVPAAQSKKCSADNHTTAKKNSPVTTSSLNNNLDPPEGLSKFLATLPDGAKIDEKWLFRQERADRFQVTRHFPALSAAARIIPKFGVSGGGGGRYCFLIVSIVN